MGLVKYAAAPAAERNANFDNAMGIKDGMSKDQLKALLENLILFLMLSVTKTCQ